MVGVCHAHAYVEYAMRTGEYGSTFNYFGGTTRAEYNKRRKIRHVPADHPAMSVASNGFTTVRFGGWVRLGRFGLEVRVRQYIVASEVRVGFMLGG